ncbi:16S rRNA (cytosine(1402)-N(4))-methyltransferase RsmH [Dyadobacter fanqingshengii]|uniref:Ribosomal RNA small subunit methyltransferase H n=1 Tax=Dyadobacter fanqingshengii TaxID=2906443 RepID=A0A9X1PE17_9BACT|nr:16S rRNA (cytosine(1402)-N(4))-methyltransferase RsmH [Dyadobacter fanqingshengii]MCF0042419.1 16S rRNA (cytosine(1402)-N(4))-methyltransferase RsmH [Dyadobacter fanqingshengii]MCF2506609.1 16S rRNA (cytosine(1402)-N(4))-methyltransferase RsmH [Dyadobacter fanqingshengii]USJ35056.1 16S rRNA (cytosine(1402)-N(4))-methyltransferase RsmH [Dyadobacter fanqingshengii]
MDLQSTYHEPVMLSECLEGLNIQPEGVYVDVTFGGGGHSRAILEKLTTGRLLVFDQDPDAAANAAEFKDDKRFTFIAANFRHLKRYLKLHKAEKVDGILGDLGVSSHQINTPERGFSTRFDADLDMRMNPNIEKTAREVINSRSSAELQRILGMYGEVTNARTAAEAIFTSRHSTPIDTVADLKGILLKYAPKHRENKYFAQVFQALRIEVNDELAVLEEFLTQVPEVLNPGGRLVVMSYHSLEDRLVKNFILKGKFDGELEKDFYGNAIRPLSSVTRKPVEATPEEVARNPRARSAKLRIAEKI